MRPTAVVLVKSSSYSFTEIAQSWCDLKGCASYNNSIMMCLYALKGLVDPTLLEKSCLCQCCLSLSFHLQVRCVIYSSIVAFLCQKSGNAVLGLPYALASLSFCQSYNLDLLKASATLTLAELWLSLGASHAKRSLALIHSALPMILGHGGLELRARAYIAEAKCYLSDICFSGIHLWLWRLLVNGIFPFQHFFPQYVTACFILFISLPVSSVWRSWDGAGLFEASFWGASTHRGMIVKTNKDH